MSPYHGVNIMFTRQSTALPAIIYTEQH